MHMVILLRVNMEVCSQWEKECNMAHGSKSKAHGGARAREKNAKAGATFKKMKGAKVK
jgi:hypothetical protein